MGLGNFKGEELSGKNLVNSYKGSLFYSLNQKFPLQQNKLQNKFVDKSGLPTFASTFGTKSQSLKAFVFLLRVASSSAPPSI